MCRKVKQVVTHGILSLQEFQELLTNAKLHYQRI